MTDLVARPLPARNLAELGDVTITSIADGEIIVWDSGTAQYINNTLAEAGIAGTSHTHTASDVTDFNTAADARIAAAGINALSDVTITAAASGDFLRHNGTAWVDTPLVAADLPALVGDSGSGGTKGAAPAPASGDAAAGKFLKADGTWAVPAGSGVSGIDDLSDVTITAAASGDFLRHNGTAWVDAVIVAADLPAMVGDSGAGGTKGAVPAPSAGDAAANKYLKADGTWATVSGGSGSSHWHDPVECVTTADVSLSGGGVANGTTHDGITVSTGQRILVANQTSTTENGIYIVPASGAASRASDMAAAYNASGDVVTIKRGTLYADYWALVTSNSSVVGTDPITIYLLNNGATAKELGWPANLLLNSSFREWGHTVSTSGVALTGGAYNGPTGWYQLTSGNNCTIALGTGIGSSGGSFKITNGAGAARRVAIAQFVEYYDCLPLRGKAVRFSIKVKQTTTGNMRAALVNWTGTANAPTKNIVNTWTSTTYTEGNFFISSGNLDIIAVSSAVSVGSTATEISVTGTVGASANNLQMIVWSEDEFDDTEIIEFGDPMLVLGSTAVQYQDQPLNIEKFLCEYRCILHFSDANQTDAILGWGHAASTTVAVCQVPLGRPMRVVPTLTATAGDWQVADSVGARQDVTALAISTTVSSRRIIFMTSTVASGLTVGRGMATVADTTSGRWLKFDAEIGT